MIKKIFLTLGCVLLVLGSGAYLFKEQLWEIVIKVVTSDTFIAADTDSFDPGLAVGKPFPNIKAVYQDQEVVSVSGFAYNKGMVFVANRSADW